MPVFALGDEPVFPPPELAEADGLLAVGGDLGPARIIRAYARGIFPWYSDETPILWWSPDPRLVLFPRELKISRSLRQVIRRGVYRVTCDEAFEKVITGCASAKRGSDEGTWITGEMIRAYCVLHEMGYAHSVESWDGDELAGGLYGISLGRIFFGESMFANRPNASKVAFATIAGRLAAAGFELIDCQVRTAHLESFGAREITGDTFREILRRSVGLQPAEPPWDTKTASPG